MLTHRADTIIGNIPSDWRKALLKNLLSEHLGGDWGDDEGDVAIRVLRSTNFSGRGTLDIEGAAVRYFPRNRADGFSLAEKDILLERSGGGPTQPVGRIGVIPQALNGYWFSNFVQLLRPDPSAISPDLLAWLLLRLHQSGVIERLQHQTTQMRNLDFRDYLRVYLPFPLEPVEQHHIAELFGMVSTALAEADRKVLAARRLRTALMQYLFTTGIPGRHFDLQHAKVFRHDFVVPRAWNLEQLRAPEQY